MTANVLPGARTARDPGLEDALTAFAKVWVLPFVRIQRRPPGVPTLSTTALRRRLRPWVLRIPVLGRLVAVDPTQFVFIVASGRSGSTLVQGLLNALPRTLVRGENSLFLLAMFRGIQATRVFRRIYGENSDRVTSAYFGLSEIDTFELARSLRAPVVRQLLGRADRAEVDVLGFKEVRWEQIEPDETAHFFRFFEQVFPGAKYVLVERDVETVADSGHWVRVPRAEALEALHRGRDVRQFLRDSRADRVYDVTYELITGDDERAADDQLSGLARFVLGTDDADVRARMREVLKVGHGPFPFGRVRRRRGRHPD